MFKRAILMLSVLLLPSIHAEEAKEKDTAEAQKLPPRRAAWSLGSDARLLNIKTDNSTFEYEEWAPDINGGYAWIKDSSWVLTRVHLAVGPTSVHFDDSPPLDFSGYGFSLQFGYTVSGSKLRTPSGDYNLEVGIENFELVGRSFRRQVLPDGSTSNSWIMKTRWTGVSAGISATFLKPARPAGNKPEWLMTRLEGYRIGLGVVVPVQSSWDLRYERNAVGLGDRGKWKGILPVVSLSAFLGV